MGSDPQGPQGQLGVQIARSALAHHFLRPHGLAVGPPPQSCPRLSRATRGKQRKRKREAGARLTFAESLLVKSIMSGTVAAVPTLRQLV